MMDRDVDFGYADDEILATTVKSWQDNCNNPRWLNMARPPYRDWTRRQLARGLVELERRKSLKDVMGCDGNILCDTRREALHFPTDKLREVLVREVTGVNDPNVNSQPHAHNLIIIEAVADELGWRDAEDAW